MYQPEASNDDWISVSWRKWETPKYLDSVHKHSFLFIIVRKSKHVFYGIIHYLNNESINYLKVGCTKATIFHDLIFSLIHILSTKLRWFWTLYVYVLKHWHRPLQLTIQVPSDPLCIYLGLENKLEYNLIAKCISRPLYRYKKQHRSDSSNIIEVLI